MSAHGPVALVTGGSRGIGRATTLALARDGIDVVVGYRQDSVAASGVVEEAEQLGVRALACRADLGNAKGVDRLLTAAKRFDGGVDILVNNAGFGRYADISELTLREWEQMIWVNLTAPFLLIRAMLPGMCQRGFGRIVNVASTAGVTGGEGSPDYAASKGGLIALTRHLARKVAADGVTVNSVAPNTTDTDMFPGLGLADQREYLEARHPSRRFATASEVGSVIAFLCSPAASYVSGECVTIGCGA